MLDSPAACMLHSVTDDTTLTGQNIMKTTELWLFLLLIGVLALNWPFLAVFGANLPVYLFLAWSLLIAAIYIFAGKAANDDSGG